MIDEMMSRRNFPMNENNRRQAEVPESCVVLKNATGTAPGMWLKKTKPYLYLCLVFRMK
jgi:nicotinamide-nucleotide amidase